MRRRKAFTLICKSLFNLIVNIFGNNNNCYYLCYRQREIITKK